MKTVRTEMKYSVMVSFGGGQHGTVDIIPIWPFSGFPLVWEGPSTFCTHPYCREGCAFPVCLGGIVQWNEDEGKGPEARRIRSGWGLVLQREWE